MFQKAQDEELIGALKKIIVKENIDISDDAVKFIVSVADGAFRDAVKFLEQVSFSKKKITIDTITDLFSASGDDVCVGFLDALAQKDEKRAFLVVEQLIKEAKDIRGFMTDILHKLQGILVSLGKGEQVSGWDKTHIQHAIACFLDAYALLKNSPIAELPLELAILSYFGESGTASSPAPTTKPMSPLQEEQKLIKHSVSDTPVKVVQNPEEVPTKKIDESFTVEKLNEYWKDIIEALKPFNHSVAGVMRSAHPKEIKEDLLVIETQYKFHQERLSEANVRDMVSTVLKKLFGVKVRIEVVLA